MDYKFAKEKLPDWTAYCSEQLKSDLKIIVLREYLKTHNRTLVMEVAQREIKKFTSEIEDDEIAKNFFQSLSEFSAELIEKCETGLGEMTAHQIANSLRQSLTRAKTTMLNNSSKNDLTMSFKSEEASVVAQVVQNSNQLVLDFAYNRATSANTFYGDVQSSVKQWLNDYKAMNKPKGYIYSSQERAYAEMNIRYNAYLQNKKSLQEQGVKIVVVPSHANCSKRCQPYQGRIYSLDGTSGTFDGRKYIPIEDVSDKVTYTSARTGKTYYAGLFSYNCRHQMKAYKEGMNIEVIPDDVIERQRSIEEQQRLIERTYRKGREEYAILNELYKKTKDSNIQDMMRDVYRKNVTIRKKYTLFCEKNNIPQYRDRLKVIIADNGRAKEIAQHIDEN